MRHRYVSLVVTVLLLIDILIPVLNTTSLNSSEWLFIDYSFKSSTSGLVYPGSRSAQLTIVMRYVGSGTAINPLACLYVPTGFQIIDTNCIPARDFKDNILYNVTTGGVVYFKFGIDVNRSVNPGLYNAYVNLTYFSNFDNNLYWLVINLTLEVSQYPSLNLEITDSYFTPYNYPGARYVNIILGIRNIGETTINNLRINLKLPSELADPCEINYTYAFTVSPGGEVYLSLGPVSINPSVSPNTQYVADLHIDALLETSDNVVYTDEGDYVILLKVGSTAPVKLNILTYELTSNNSLPGLKNTGFRILIQSLENSLLRLIYSKVFFENAESINGSNNAVYIHDFTLNYLDTVWLTYNGLVIYENASYIRLNTTIYGSVIIDNVEYPFSLNLWFTIPLVNRDLDIVVEKIWWEREVAYPGSVNNLIISILNNETSLAVTDAVVELEVRTSVIYPNKLVVYNIVFNTGSLVEIVFTNIVIPESTKPGIYEALLRISGLIKCIDESFKQIELVRDIFIVIANYSSLEPVLPIFSIIDVYWGEGFPQYVYPGDSIAPLTITVQNIGVVSVSNTILIVNSIEPSDTELLSKTAVCSIQLAPGSVCSVTVYLDLKNSSSGLKLLNISIKYNLEVIGVSKVFTQNAVVSIYLPEYPPGRGVAIASYSWLNNYPVYNGSKGAVLTITLVNLEAYSVNSIWINLKTPIGINTHSGFSNKIYVSGPLAPLQTTTISYTLDLDCSPGNYSAIVDLDYYVQSNNGGTRKKQQHTIDLKILSSSNSIEYVTHGWLSTPKPPPVYGAQLYIIFRNSEFPSITNPILKLKLPNGVVESRTNSSEAVLLPLARFTPQQLVLNQFSQNMVIQLLTQYIQQPYTGSISKGDFVTYVVSLNIERNYSVFEIPYTLVFIDHWGGEYSFSSVLTIKYLTTPPILIVYPKTPLIVFSNGTGFLDIVILNNYSTPIANIYLALTPVSGNAIPLNTIKYIEKLFGKTSTIVRFELVYNPVQTQFSSIQLSSSSAVFTVVLIYTDVTGVLHNINTTFAVMIKPFIELTILPGVNAKYVKDTVTVNGVIANLGISTAKSVVVILKYSSYEAISIVGDVDSSSQVPFRVEIKAPYVSETCVVIVKYRDEYNVEYYYREELRVIQITEETGLTSSPKQQFDNLKYIVLAATIVFLTSVFIVIYRRIRRIAGRE